ncbi:2-oxoglutarate dehydrogenase complex dihydrolipoyllysine-residue succinyltransferase [Blochmannia endosymbiont of Polyrhachis (Hedomyrma) turneri]|uniref:2-oxoglutarate dehydrogenase complex dihydrolipoyllysine-residue succinyltransferase n=1 Tax=Blochmannia endosymbiont of Polyrhachis (Hedomyrma) turneri TaxID=1505596 RepID=UPI00061A5C4A|nr:2-oxoglutarate dehydrogenase complex dihydrolipoyllysine-residue succinyltransferase [Blochmannia endosymbiont of Polyrhachis (Hedomyrma) turneri]AKC59901.1 Dihydrolipoyllysine-residue succinyltransferase component of 2-oxoglutarate dehydrogenase complex [Blochmannia endosymbiont of Polyrhachis (Hedomyrma) turneri]
MNNKKNILVPNLPESISDAVVAVWHKQIKDNVTQGEILVELETDKIMIEVPAEESGILESIFQDVGATVVNGQILGKLLLNDNNHCSNTDINIQSENTQSVPYTKHEKNILKTTDDVTNIFSPSIRRLVHEYNLQPESILKIKDIHGQITRESIKKYLFDKECEQLSIPVETKSEVITKKKDRNDVRIPMSRLRKRIAERLLEVKNNTAMLTTFNEVNMKPIIDIRKKYGEIFEKKHNVRLGFMSFYVKAVLEALKSFPNINASIDGEEIVHHNYFDISIAVSTSRGLVTPVLKNIDLLSISEIEKEIKNMAGKGRDGKLTIQELSGGTFTITNGGVFGSLISTPIINPPQSAILGMHAIKDRPMAINGEIVILPMMYLALSYDHRLIDGKDSINFLIKIKELLENPIRFLLDI